MLEKHRKVAQKQVRKHAKGEQNAQKERKIAKEEKTLKTLKKI